MLSISRMSGSTYSEGYLWQATVRFRGIFFFFVDAKRQIWLTSNYMLRNILRFSQAVARAYSVVFEATCTSSGNKQKVRHFRNDCVSTLSVELTCENCKEFADHPFRVTHRTKPAKRNNEFCNRTCVFIRSTYVPNALSKQAAWWHTIFIPYSHDFHTRYSLNQCFQKSRTPSR